MARIIDTVSENISSPASSVNVRLPYYAVGDLLVVSVVININGPTTTPPGWSVAVEHLAGLRGINFQIFYKFATTLNESFVTTSSGTPTWVVAASSVRGVDTTSPIAATASSQINAVSQVTDAPSVTTTSNDSLVLYFAACYSTAVFFDEGSEELLFKQGANRALIVSKKVQETPGATGTNTCRLSATNSGIATATIAFNNAASTIEAALNPPQWEFLFRSKAWDDLYDPKTFNLNIYDLITSFNGFTVNDDTGALDPTAEIQLDRQQAYLYRNSAAGADGFYHGLYFPYSGDFSGKIFSIFLKPSNTSFIQPEGISVILFNDSSNYGAWSLPLSELSTGGRTLVFNCDSTPVVEEGTFDPSNVTNIGIIWRRVGGGAASQGFLFANLAIFESLRLVGGVPDKVINYRSFENESTKLDLQGFTSFRGLGQMFSAAPLIVGDGATSTFFSISGTSFEPPLLNGNSNLYYFDEDQYEFTINASSNDVINFSSASLASQGRQSFNIAPTSSTSASYVFNGMTLSGWAVNWKTGIALSGVSFNQCYVVDVKATTVNNCTIQNSQSTTHAIRLEDGAALTNCTFVKGAEANAVLIDSAGDFDFSGTTFSGYTTVINVTATTGTVNITLAEGQSEPTVSTAGATVNFLTPAVTYTLQLANIIDGSRYQIYNVTSDSELTNAVVSGGSGIDEQYTLGTDYQAGDEGRFRITFQSGTTCKQTIEASFTFAASTTTNSIPTSQTDDAVYAQYNVDGSGITEFSWDSGNIQIDINDANNTTAIQRLAAWFCFFLTTEIGIREAFGAISWLSINSIRVNTSDVDVKIDNTKSAPLFLNGGRLFRDDGSTIIASTSNSIQIDYDPVYALETGVSGLTSQESAQLLAIGTPAEVADAVWDEPLEDHLSAGSTGEALDGAGGSGSAGPTEAEIYTYFTTSNRQDTFKADVSGVASQSSVDTIDANVDAILVDTETTLPTQINALNNLSAADVNAEVDQALADYDVPTKTELDAVQTSIEGLINGLNDLSAADVNAEVDSALADYDGPTKAELDAVQTAIENAISSLNDLDQTEVAEAVWDYLQSESTVSGSLKEAVETVLSRSALIPASV